MPTLQLQTTQSLLCNATRRPQSIACLLSIHKVPDQHRQGYSEGKQAGRNWPLSPLLITVIRVINPGFMGCQEGPRRRGGRPELVCSRAEGRNTCRHLLEQLRAAHGRLTLRGLYLRATLYLITTWGLSERHLSIAGAPLGVLYILPARYNSHMNVRC